MHHLLDGRALIILASLFLSVSPVFAIKHCHDYTAFVVTGNNFNGTPPNALRTILKEHNYTIAFTTTAATPGVDGRLRPSDVVFFGDAHSGVVNSEGRIDHFLQNMQQTGRLYGPNELPSLPNFHRGWTMVQFANISREAGVISTDFATDAQPLVHYPYRNMKLEVWRKSPNTASQGGVPMIGGTWLVTVTEANSKLSYEYSWEIRRSPGSTYITWPIRQTLLQPNPARNWSKGQTWEDSYFEFRDGIIEYNRARTVYAFSQWATCTFRENSFSCSGTQGEFGRTQDITITGNRMGATGGEENRPSANAAAGSEGAFAVSSVIGDAEIIRGGKSYPLKSGMRVSSGDRIVTGMDSEVQLNLPDAVVKVRELTDFKVDLTPEPDRIRTLLWLKAGEVEADHQSQTASPFSVQTGVAGAGPRGTRFAVRHNEQTGITTITVTEGAVAVTPENRELGSFVLRALERAEVGRTYISPITRITTAEENRPREKNGGSASGTFTRRDNTTISPPAKILRYFGSNSEDACKTSCAGDQGCVAYTFVRRGGYQPGDPPMCYLMSSLGPQVEHSCCVSGFKGDSAAERGTSSSLPRVIRECEPICGTWTLEGDHYNAVWDNGARAIITYRFFNDGRVIFLRRDTTQVGFTARYEGRIIGNGMKGSVTWTSNGQSWSGQWTATW